MREFYMDEQTGLRHCSICHMPIEAFYANGAEVLGRRTHPVPCQCQKEKQQRQEGEQKEREHRDLVWRLRKEAFSEIPAGEWKFSAVPLTRQLEKAKEYTNHWEEMRDAGIGLLLFGNVGTGKSYAAGCIANALIEQEQSVRFVGLSDVVNRMQGLYGTDRDHYLQELLKPDLLILDDLGAERNTSFGKEQVFDVINKRTTSGRPMIVTTNLSLRTMQQTEDLQDRRIFDRVLEVCMPIRFEGESFRKAGAAENLKKAAAILGK